VSYIFAGEQDLDLGLALEILNREQGIKRLPLEGGGVPNGAFLRAGLIDEATFRLSISRADNRDQKNKESNAHRSVL
jgi:riboflavin biosynthesis pyrimidine reductase